eukprot:scaffold439595_cov19-Prasinocladus_malaysianus.AAC.1
MDLHRWTAHTDNVDKVLTLSTERHSIQQDTLFQYADKETASHQAKTTAPDSRPIIARHKSDAVGAPELEMLPSMTDSK